MFSFVGFPLSARLTGMNFSMYRYGVGNIEYGEDLLKCRSRISLYCNNTEEFVDLRGCGW